MIAAIYVRKSTDQKVADESKSTTRQLELAKAYAAKHGWIVDERYVFIDEGISGAEFDKRPALSKMRAMLGSRAPFGVLIVRDKSRLGREMSETAYLLKQLDKAKVDVVSYVDGKSLIPKSHKDKLLAAVEAFSEEDTTKAASKNVIEAFQKLAQSGRVTGGRVYAYRNVDVFNGVDQHGRPKRSHVERKVVAVEAKVVRRIFELFSSGLGLKAIARTLNQEGVAPPKPFVRKSEAIPNPNHKWAPSTIRTILRNPLYKGLLVWNKTKKRNHHGEVDPTPRPESEWISTPVEHLRIVSNELWDRCAARRKEIEGRAVRFADGRISGRPPASDTRNLLAGIATCSVCGGGIVVETSKRKTGRKSEYVCYRRRTTDCTNALRMPVDVVNEQILSTIEEHALTPEAIEQVIQLSQRDDVREKHDALRKEQQDVARRIDRLVAVIAEGADAPAAVLAKLREMEARQKAIEGELRALQPIPRLAAQVVEDRLAEWRRLLRQSVTQGRAVLQRILKGRIVFTPRGEGYDFNCETRYDRLFTGVAVKRPAFLPEGGAPAFSPEDTWDSDYGGLLEAAHRKGHEAVRGRQFRARTRALNCVSDALPV